MNRKDISTRPILDLEAVTKLGINLSEQELVSDFRRTPYVAGFSKKRIHKKLLQNIASRLERRNADFAVIRHISYEHPFPFINSVAYYFSLYKYR